MMYFSVKVAIQNSIFVSAGTDGRRFLRELEVVGKYTCKVQPLPEGIMGHSMVINRNNELMVLGGQDDTVSDKSKICLVYKNNEWTYHSTMVMRRIYSCTVVMPDGIYVFGGRPCVPPLSHLLCEFLPNDQLHWSILDTKIPNDGIMMASCVAVSPFKIVFTGGVGDSSRSIMTFNTMTKKWKNEGKLNHQRWEHTSFLFNGKIIITGGQNDTEIFSSTEILTLKPTKLREGGRLHEARSGHGIGVFNIKGTQKLLVFGGCSVNPKVRLSSVEAWNDEEECWEKTDLHLPQVLSHFAYCSKSEHNKYPENGQKISALAKLHKFFRSNFMK